MNSIPDEFEDAMETWGHGLLDALVDLPDIQEMAQLEKEEQGYPQGATLLAGSSFNIDEAIHRLARTEHPVPSGPSAGVALGYSSVPRSTPRYPSGGVNGTGAAGPQVGYGASDSDGRETESLLDARLRRAFKSLWAPRHILLKDKLSFLLGCTLLWCAVLLSFACSIKVLKS